MKGVVHCDAWLTVSLRNCGFCKDANLITGHSEVQFYSVGGPDRHRLVLNSPTLQVWMSHSSFHSILGLKRLLESTSQLGRSRNRKANSKEHVRKSVGFCLLWLVRLRCRNVQAVRPLSSHVNLTRVLQNSRSCVCLTFTCLCLYLGEFSGNLFK